ncbi:MAG: lactonase family protein [Acidobacteriia bacterium]|nr:lactonase family protein [Terriglobia bacterium]
MLNIRILITAAALAATALTAQAQYTAYVGPYTRPNKSKGIYAFKFDAKTGKFTSIGLAAETSNPSFLAIHPNGKFLYAVNENNQGMVSAFAIEPSGTLKPLNSVSSKGSGPCHLTLDKTGKWLFVANYNNGSVASYPVNADGSLGEAASSVQHQGSSANPQRQRGPHAHETVLSPDGKLLFVPDLGMDKIMEYRFDGKGALTPNDPPSIAIAAGSGPRHMAFDPKGRFVYVLTEMTDSVIAFSYDGKGGAKEMQTISAVPSDFTGSKSGAEIAVHPNGRFLYASNRNHNSIGIFTIDAKGALTAAGNVSSQGKTPRHFLIDPTGAYLIVSNQDSDNIVIFKIDPKTGGLTPTGDVLEVGNPVSMVFGPAK